MIKVRGQDCHGAPRKKGDKSYTHEGIGILPNSDLGEVYDLYR